MNMQPMRTLISHVHINTAQDKTTARGRGIYLDKNDMEHEFMKLRYTDKS